MTAQTDVGRDQDGDAIQPRPHSTRPPSATRTWLNRFDTAGAPYLYVAPFFLIFATFGAFPLIYTAWVSLHDWNLLEDSHPFIGLENYTKVLADEQFWNAAYNTMGMFVLATIPQLLAALWLADLLNRSLRMRTFFRISLLIPNITSIAAVAIIFAQLFSTDFGLVNWLLSGLGLDHQDWHSNRYLSWIAISTMVNWRWAGYNALIFLAAMQAIPRDLYESAAIDGANRTRQLWSITIPMLKPTLVFCVIVSTIGNLQLFVEPLLFNSGSNSILGGPGREAQTITMYMYENAFGDYNNFGYGSAVAWMLFLLIVVIALINVVVTRRIRGEERR